MAAIFAALFIYDRKEKNLPGCSRSLGCRRSTSPSLRRISTEGTSERRCSSWGFLTRWASARRMQVPVSR